MINPKRYYLDTFSVAEESLAEALKQALSGGGSYADLYFEYTTYGSLSLRDGAVTSGGKHTDYGVGVRVLDGEKTGYAYCESVTPRDILSSAKAASNIVSGGHSGSVEVPATGTIRAGRLFRGEPNPAADRYPVQTSWRDVSMDRHLPLLLSLEEKVRARRNDVVKVLASLSFSVSDILMYNSLGELKYDTRPMGTVSVTVICSRNGVAENKTVSKSFRTGVELLREELIDKLAEEVTSGIDQRFEAIRPKGGTMSVVMGAGASGILLHEAIGHAFEADFIRKGQSIFTGRLGQRVCSESISVVDDGTIRGCRGSLNFDDEGVPAQKTYMVEHGILTSFLHDRISAAHFDTAPTGNGRRESFRYAPIPRMRTTYMESADAAPGDIIASVGKGIYVDEFSNGQVKIGEGDFTFFVKSGFLIEDGHLTRPVKDINIIGNGPEALSDIRAVGNDLKVDEGAWTCGKEQSVPVSCGIPTVLVGKLTVGGE